MKSNTIVRVCTSIIIMVAIITLSCLGVSAEVVSFPQYEVEYFNIVSKNTATGEVSTRTLNTAFTTSLQNRGIEEWSCEGYFPESEKYDTTYNTRSESGIIGTDDRQPVANLSTTHPYRGICRIVTYWDLNEDGIIDDIVGIATGFVNGYSSVVTSGHVIYNNEVHKWCEYAEITAAQNGTSTPLGTQTSTIIHTSEAWIQSGDFNQDWAIIEIDEELGRRTGYLGLKGTTSSMNGMEVTLTGYPGDKPQTMWTSSGVITNSYDAWLEYDCDAVGGQSGSPVYNNENKVVAIHSASGNPTCNGGVRITKWLFETLKEFR